MPKITKFKPKQTAKGWCINVPAKFTETGKRERCYYKTRGAAEEASSGFKDKKEKHGESAKSISPTLAEQATAAAAILAPFGLTVLEAARIVAEIETAKLKSSTIESSLLAFLKAKEGKSTSHTRQLDYMAEALRQDFKGRMLSTISGNELEEHAESRTNGATAFNLRCRLLSSFWRWCAVPKRGWCNPDAIQHFERKESVSGEIGTLTPLQANALLQAAEKHHPDTVAAFSIALFTGVRQAELERLEPSDITAEGITVPARSAKTAKRRFIDMPPTLAAWLKVYPVGESVLPGNWERKERAVRRLAGFRVWSDWVEPNDPPDDLTPWPGNALRHTAATVAIATGEPMSKLIFQHGHSGGETTLKNHYVGRMTKKDALVILTIGPNGTKICLKTSSDCGA